MCMSMLHALASRRRAVSDNDVIRINCMLAVLRVLMLLARAPSMGILVSRNLVWGFPSLIAIGNFV